MIEASRDYPVVLTTSVIRSTHQGESHGGAYLVDLSDGHVQQLIDWNEPGIDWGGRGIDRGLRGIAFYEDYVYLAASEELLVYDKEFKLLERLRNGYMKHVHEICRGGDSLYLSSTGFDSILELDLRSGEFVNAYFMGVDVTRGGLRFGPYDPRRPGGARKGDTVHLNMVHYQDCGIYASGLGLTCIACIRDGQLSNYASIPDRTHNSRPYRDRVLLNETSGDRLSLYERSGEFVMGTPVPRYPKSDLKMRQLPEDHARQGFARGLCIADNGLIVGGSSPSTLSVYEPENLELLKSVNLTMDVRNAIHGLEIWPY